MPAATNTTWWLKTQDQWSYGFRGLDWAASGHAACNDTRQSPVNIRDDIGEGVAAMVHACIRGRSSLGTTLPNVQIN